MLLGMLALMPIAVVGSRYVARPVSANLPSVTSTTGTATTAVPWYFQGASTTFPRRSPVTLPIASGAISPSGIVLCHVAGTPISIGTGPTHRHWTRLSLRGCVKP